MQQIYVQSDVNKAIDNVFNTLRSILKNVDDSVVTWNDRGMTIHTRLQLLFNLKFEHELEASIYEHVLSHAFNAEKLSSGGFDLCIQKVTEVMLSKIEETNTLSLKESLDSILGSGAVVPNKIDIDWVINAHSKGISKKISNMLNDAINLAGFAGRVVLEKSVTEKSSVELVRGYTFNVTTGFPISAKFREPKIIVMDAYIEGVHEIDKLLNDAANEKVPVLLFARGMSNDVLHTLKVNYDRGSLKVVPIIVPFDFEGINTLADVCVVTAADYISTAKGDLVSTANMKTAPMIESGVVYQNKVVLINTKTIKSVYAHVERLRQRRQDENEDETAKFFDKRIKSLSPNHVVIRLPDDKDYVRNSQTIDYVLRAYKSLLQHGTVKVDGKKILTSTFAATMIQTIKCIDSLKTIGAVVI